MTNCEFWKVVKPLLTNKGIISANSIALEENGTLVNDEKILVEIFNNYYVNIVEHTTGVAPLVLGDPSNPEMDNSSVRTIIDVYKNHPIILKIKDKLPENHATFSLPLAKKEEINSIMKQLDVKKSTGNDTIPHRLVKEYADILDEPLTMIKIEKFQVIVFQKMPKRQTFRRYIKRIPVLLRKTTVP